MAKKKKGTEKEIEAIEEIKEPEETKPAKAEIKLPPKNDQLPYEERMWKGIKKVFMCKECEHFEDSKDEIILHVLKHAPMDEREQLFNELMR